VSFRISSLCFFLMLTNFALYLCFRSLSLADYYNLEPLYCPESFAFLFYLFSLFLGDPTRLPLREWLSELPLELPLDPVFLDIPGISDLNSLNFRQFAFFLMELAIYFVSSSALSSMKTSKKAFIFSASIFRSISSLVSCRLSLSPDFVAGKTRTFELDLKTLSCRTYYLRSGEIAP
jgi:hypothetical protein